MMIRRVKDYIRGIGWLSNVVANNKERKAYLQAERFLKDESHWLKYQKESLHELLTYARKHSQYYKQIIPSEFLKGGNIIGVLKSLPLLSKDIIREEQYIIFSDEVKPETRWANTGGSTGEPLRFPVISSGKELERICQAMLYQKMGGKVCDLIVSVDGTRIAENDLKKNVYWKKEKSNFPYGKYAMSTLYMKHETLPYYISFLNQVKPIFLRGYPSGVLEIAKYCRNKDIKLDFIPKGIYLTSENYGEAEESMITTAFNCPVYGQYGHTESSIFAIKTPGESEYYCLPIYGYTEILNSEGTQVKEGDIGEIVVSGFNHYGMPFIRYKTGDFAVYGGKTNNGSVILKTLLGRSIDYIINKDGEKVFLVGFIFGGHLKAFNHIAKWQLEQKEQGIVCMKIVKGPGYNNDIEKEIIELFKKKKIGVIITYVSDIDKTKRGKSRFMIQHLQ